MTIVTHRGKKIKLTLDKEDVFDYLIELRDSGITNMWGASPFIARNFDCSDDEAAYWLLTWIKSFD